MNTHRSRHLGMAASLVVAAALAGCGERSDNQTVGQKLDSAIDQTAQAGREVREGGREAAEDARTAVMGAASGARQATSTVGARVDDAQITAQVKTGLSVDKSLSAGKIDVDTKEGIVTLTGNAPSEEARRRATEIARNVKDVKDVKNQLTLKTG